MCMAHDKWQGSVHTVAARLKCLVHRPCKAEVGVQVVGTINSTPFD